MLLPYFVLLRFSHHKINYSDPVLLSKAEQNYTPAILMNRELFEQIEESCPARHLLCSMKKPRGYGMVRLNLDPLLGITG
ncbi:hypothetical protein RB195_020024 [Necator americanus]|uniref:Uncharacterized protein n=1 Tax=Necator americanus TaxID=51031 RepID=A0ABR1CGU7_NECAM